MISTLWSRELFKAQALDSKGKKTGGGLQSRCRVKQSLLFHLGLLTPQPPST